MKRLKYIIVPACMVIIAVIAITFNQNKIFNTIINENNGKKEWKIKEVHIDSRDTTEEMAIVRRWEELTTPQKFNSVQFSNIIYTQSNADTKLQYNKIGEKIEDAILNGRDAYTDTEYSINAELYEVIDFPQKCAIAVKFEGEEDYYIYINQFYRPTTLGEFMSDLKLKDIVSFGKVYYQYADTDTNGQYRFNDIEFYDVDNEKIWQMLFSDLGLPNVEQDGESYTSQYFKYSIGISVDIPLLGIENISVTLTDKGYLETNIFARRKVFYIGEDKVQEFLNYLINNYDGYKIVYVDEAEEDNNIKEELGEEKIMMVENTVNGFVTKEVDMNTMTTDQSNSTKPYTPNM